jgi:radical SAM protein with 4Fe4S-binding SPASM domain
MNPANKLKVGELYLTGMANFLDFKRYKFFFNCNGLSGIPAKVLQLNVSSMRLSQLCPFVDKAAVACEDVKYNIYHPKLTEAANTFVLCRLNALKRLCQGCELIAICRGGCIMTGLDSDNELNQAACTYQKTMWHEFLEMAYSPKDFEKRRNALE